MTIDELNLRYGAPGRIVFRTGFAGYPEVVLANKYGSSEVALLGANVLSYRPTGIGPVIFRPEKRNYNRGESFHGGIPVCWPQFGRLAIESMAQHGFARFMPFEVKHSEYSEDMTEIVLSLKSNEETKKLWNHDFELEIKISVSMKLNLTMTTKNTGDEPFEFTGGLHPYFRVANRDDVSVRGLDGVEYVYAVDMSEHTLTGDLSMTGDTDHVFSLLPSPRHEFVIFDSKLNRATALVSSGNDSVVVWNPGEGLRLPDLAEDDWKKFVCVEPVTAWPRAKSTLGAGESHELTVAIQSSIPEP